MPDTKQITIDREFDGMKWAHFGCPKCGYIRSLPQMGNGEPPWCVHNADNIVWPWFVEDNGMDEDREWAGPMVPVIVTYKDERI